MPKLKPETWAARREHILDTAEKCFARSGFHRCTTAEICKEAGISAGALYVHFGSKEDLISGIVSRDRERITQQLGQLGDASDLAAALTALGRHYAVEEPQYKRILNLEIAAEATRNEVIAGLVRAADQFVIDGLTELIGKASSEGRIEPAQSAHDTAMMLCVIGEGLFWRRAVDPTFDGAQLMPAVMSAVVDLLKPTDAAGDLPGQTARTPGTVEERL